MTLNTFMPTYQNQYQQWRRYTFLRCSKSCLCPIAWKWNFQWRSQFLNLLSFQQVQLQLANCPLKSKSINYTPLNMEILINVFISISKYILVLAFQISLRSERFKLNHTEHQTKTYHFMPCIPWCGNIFIEATFKQKQHY